MGLWDYESMRVCDLGLWKCDVTGLCDQVMFKDRQKFFISFLELSLPGVISLDHCARG